MMLLMMLVTSNDPFFRLSFSAVSNYVFFIVFLTLLFYNTVHSFVSFSLLRIIWCYCACHDHNRTMVEL